MGGGYMALCPNCAKLETVEFNQGFLKENKCVNCGVPLAVGVLQIVEIDGKNYFKDSRLREYRNVEDFADSITMLICEDCGVEFNEFDRPELMNENQELLEDWKAGFGAPLCKKCDDKRQPSIIAIQGGEPE